MADKNYSGNIYHRFKTNEDHLIKQMDERDQNGTNRENVDEVYSNHRTDKDRNKVWSF